MDLKQEERVLASFRGSTGIETQLTGNYAYLNHLKPLFSFHGLQMSTGVIYGSVTYATIK